MSKEKCKKFLELRIEQVEAQDGIMCMLSKEKLIREYQIALDDLNEEETVEINTVGELIESIISGHIYSGIDPEDGVRATLIYEADDKCIIVVDEDCGVCHHAETYEIITRIFNHGELYQLDNPLLKVK
jgi:hypothetical protein